MKNIKKISALLSIIMVSVLLTSCKITLPKIKKNYTPEESMKVYIDASCLKENSDTVDFIGSEEEKNALYVSGKIKVKNKIIDELSKEGVSASDKQVEKIYEAVLRAVNKIDFKIEKVSEENDVAQVKITCNYLDLSNIQNNVNQYVEEERKGAILQDEDDVIDLAINALIRGYDDSQLSDKTYEEIFEMHREGRRWAINDEDKFYNDIMNLCISE
ncbi:Hypothetical protein CM240_0231 [Clostridium bornimense]|uniref:DUF5105 domain-containing protein n=1 Tax=Clostridium bornimense TaxID=1216932 RepID=W6RS69_9CLOT|nr:DUF5105 domain-containing protein [Clostridium bornimense]CDM67401.1 Hypothetical protein CM240_0231 [Clostridium bornimense]